MQKLLSLSLTPPIKDGLINDRAIKKAPVGLIYNIEDRFSQPMEMSSMVIVELLLSTGAMIKRENDLAKC